MSRDHSAWAFAGSDGDALTVLSPSDLCLQACERGYSMSFLPVESLKPMRKAKRSCSLALEGTLIPFSVLWFVFTGPRGSPRGDPPREAGRPKRCVQLLSWLVAVLCSVLIVACSVRCS